MHCIRNCIANEAFFLFHICIISNIFLQPEPPTMGASRGLQRIHWGMYRGSNPQEARNFVEKFGEAAHRCVTHLSLSPASYRLR